MTYMFVLDDTSGPEESTVKGVGSVYETGVTERQSADLSVRRPTEPRKRKQDTRTL